MKQPSSDRVYVIAEAGVNHNGSRDLAFALVEAAAAAGADAVKFQTFRAESLASPEAPKAAYQKATTSVSESQLEMLKRLELPYEWHAPLQDHAHQLGIEFLSTAFDPESLAFLQQLDLPLYKVPSGELGNAPLLWQFAHTGKPLIMSSGMATLGEVEQALAVVCHALTEDQEPATLTDVWQAWSDPARRARLQGHVTLLHCTSQYPTPPAEVNLRAMDTLAAAFGLEVGYSDHTQGGLVPVAAVARGARIIEKHFTMDRALPGPDHSASLLPAELRQMVADIRTLELMLGDGRKGPQPGELDTRRAARQQVVAARAIATGTVLTRADLGTARCGRGLPAAQLWNLIGTTARRAYTAGEVIEP